MKNTTLPVLLASMLLATQVWAIPTLQVGAPGGAGEGTYANYIPNGVNPVETDTAFTSGSTLFVAGVYGSNTTSLGGQSTGVDWGGVKAAYSVFNGYDAILLAAVPEGFLAMSLSLTVDGFAPIFSSATLGGLFPNNHDPLKNLVSDFLFFDIGNFVKNLNAVPNFDSEDGTTAAGEIKTLTLSGAALTALPWIHFDVLALETSSQGQARIVTTIENNPGSKDVTWKTGNGGGTPPLSIPEPGVVLLLGAGLVGLGLARRRKPV